MAKIKIAGDAMVITSSKKLEDIKLLEKYSPRALRLIKDVDGEKEEIFSVATTTGKGSISTYGACFGSAAHDGTGLATITLEIPSDVKDAEAYAEERIGVSILRLNELEKQFDEAIAAVVTQKEEIKANIEVV